MKLLLAVTLMLILAPFAGAYLGINPIILFIAIIGFGFFMVWRGPAWRMPPGGKRSHWGSGHGVYFDANDVWVKGSDSEDVGDSNDVGAHR
jgi:hypothetical protein